MKIRVWNRSGEDFLIKIFITDFHYHITDMVFLSLVDLANLNFKNFLYTKVK